MDFRISAIYALLSGSLSAFLTLFVLIKGESKPINIAFASLCLCLTFFGLGAFMEFTSVNEANAFYWARFLHVGVVFIPFTFINFTYAFMELKRKDIFYWLCTATSVFFFFFLIRTNLLVKGVVPKELINYYSKPGPLYLPFVILFVTFLMYGYYLLWQGFKKYKGTKRLQLKYIFFSTFAGFAIGLSIGFALVFGKLTMFASGVHHVGVILYVVGITYGILRHNLLDIRIVMSRVGLSLAAYSFVFIIPFYIGYKTAMWPAATIVAVMLVIPATIIYRYFRIKAENVLFKKQRKYQSILLAAAERFSFYREKQGLIEEVASLLYSGVSPSFIAVYLREKGMYKLKILTPQRVILPLMLDFQHPIVEKINQEQEGYDMGDVFASLVLPIGYEEDLRGFILMGEKIDREVYFKEDVGVFRTLTSQLFLALDNMDHIRQTIIQQKEKERLKEEIEFAHQIQKGLLPQASPKTEGFQVEGLLLPALEVAGDYYDFISYGPGKVGMVVADVSGKGLDSGMVMSMTKSAVITLSRENLSPKDLVAELNKIIFVQVRQQKFVSLIYAEYSAKDNTFTWAGGGHEHVIVYRCASKEVEVIETGGIVLGMFETIDDKITQQSVVLNQGDKIFLYTDGITEAKNFQKKMLKLKGFTEMIKQSPDFPAKGLLFYLKDQIEQYTKNVRQADDITLVVLGRE